MRLRLPFFFVFCALLSPLQAEPVKPNIVFILADDLGINDLGCYGREDQLTPHLDQLATEGLRFTSAYCAQPICSPTRAAIMTGRAPARLHLTTFLPGRADAPSQRLLHPKITPQLPLEEKTLPEMLKSAGYTSACIGKWHLGGQGFGPLEQGFDIAFQEKPNTEPSETEGGKGEYVKTAAAEQFIETNKDRPFFLYLAHDNPHVRLAAKPELVEKHKDAFNPVYAAMIETLDDVVGRVLTKLESLGLKERTIVIFTSDNGGLHVVETPLTPATHNTPYRAGKGFVYEGGLRIPLIVRWPGKIAPGTISKVPVISTDWLPTLTEAAGVQIADAFDGKSLVPLLTTGQLAARPLYWHFPHYTNQGSRPAGAIRDGEWKLIEHYETGATELYNILADPSESTDLSAEEPKRAAELRGKLATWRQEVGAQENTANPKFDPNLARQLYEDIDVSNFIAGATAAETAEELTAWRETMNAVVKPDFVASEARPVTILAARDAKVHGSTMRYEAPPHKNTLGFWTKVEDWASWDFDLKVPGEYAVEILQGAGKGSGGAEVDFTFDDQTLPVTVEETGHFQNFVPRPIGRVKLTAGKHTLKVKPKTKPGAAVMDLRQVTLLPPAEPAEEKAPAEAPAQ